VVHLIPVFVRTVKPKVIFVIYVSIAILLFGIHQGVYNSCKSWKSTGI